MAADTEDLNTRAVFAFLQALTSGSAEKADPLLAEHVQWSIPRAVPDAPWDRETALQVVSSIPTMLDDFSILLFDSESGLPIPLDSRTIEMASGAPGVTAQGDRVAVEAVAHGKHQDRIYRNRYHFLFVLRDGQIARILEYNDTQHLAEVFGATVG
ncbi:nuclear transport factor 2 family protein [Sphingosinicella microcystinivorans]|uniref:nuclear transport factor 2 family protein n=1 Tax=Sphingosinicella microcystinivorans TaxID=335406 RepID=UPI0022F3E9EC|nr:hypothetical protein [Sphingosinicella microcystinivorans]WBX85780.1 hypothetical protein PE061_07690 [Sphingosinicella microcystinivorans]